jgi:hypothetical protein
MTAMVWKENHFFFEIMFPFNNRASHLPVGKKILVRFSVAPQIPGLYF